MINENGFIINSEILTHFNKKVNFEDKEHLFNYHLFNFQKKLKSMFSYENLPDTIKERNLEFCTQGSYSIFFKYENKIYNSYGGLGGVPDFNYLPTIATITIPALPQLPKQWRIDWGYDFETQANKNLDVCVVMPNDSLFMGVTPTNSYYASQLVENDLTLNCNLINLRLMNLLYARDDDAYKSLEEVIDNLKQGKISAAIADAMLVDCIKSLPFSNNQGNNIVQLLEQRQYIKGSWWNEWGVQSNYNMKRETITSSENILNVDSLLSVTDDMLCCRKNAIDLVNKNFGTNISVNFSSAWRKLRKELELKEKELESNVKNLDKNDNKQVKNFQNLEKNNEKVGEEDD